MRTFQKELKDYNRNPRRRSGGVLPKREEPTQFCEGLYSRRLAGLRKIAGFMYSPPLRSGLAFIPAPGGARFSAREYKAINLADEIGAMLWRSIQPLE